MKRPLHLRSVWVPNGRREYVLVESFRDGDKVKWWIVAHLRHRNLLAPHLDAAVRLRQAEDTAPRRVSADDVWTTSSASHTAGVNLRLHGPPLGSAYSQEQTAETWNAAEAGLLRPATLAALPCELRLDLMDAVVSLDQQRIRLVIDQFRELDGALACALGRLAEGLSYAAILSVTESSEREEAQESEAKADDPRLDPTFR